ncbi:hypothetical protein PYW07_015364 [Mythimna separata]|uniref:Uncharacterized protein n=1 Tax=Mythimna separata TaxID=271217 RepID=A0AAD8DYD6_MYTSE|nr:hypothetical protein PYW07_015364 [Mythimna separata]
MTMTDYRELKEYIVFSVGTNERHSEILSSMKEFFRDTINSIRRFEQITTIRQLLKVLEVRDLLSEDNVDCLKSIALKLPNSHEVLEKISHYENNHLPKEYGNYYSSPPQSQRKEAEDSFMTSSPLGSLSKRKRQRILDTIIQEIGSFWRDLARNLKIRECDIDYIDFQNKTLAIKATKLMEKYDDVADPQRWFFVLCDALERSRRKDLLDDQGALVNNCPWMGFPEQNREIFDIVIQNIGKFWRALGRNLKIRERDIQNIDMIQHKTLEEKAAALMEKYMRIADRQRWFFMLCDALERTQREDLVRSVKDIMSRNICLKVKSFYNFYVLWE